LDDLFQKLTDYRRAHCERVATVMKTLAERHGLPVDEAELAGLAHDLARELPRDRLIAEAIRYGVEIDEFERIEPVLLHGPVAAKWLQARGIGTPAVWEAIQYHTTAQAGIGPLAQALFVADGVEPGRHYPQRAALEELAYRDLTQGYQAVIENTLHYLQRRGLKAHPAMLAALADLGRSSDS
jgi:predicted HD superfamily hydrolase involved in NAD metabolism